MGNIHGDAHHRSRQVHLLHAVAKHVGHQIAGFEGLGVASVGHLIIRSAIDVMKDGAPQPRFGQLAKLARVEETTRRRSF